MKFERGKNPKKSIGIGVKPTKVWGAMIRRPNEETIYLDRNHLLQFWKNYIQREIYQDFPQHFFFIIPFTNNQGLDDAYRQKLSSFEGEYVQVDDTILLVPKFPPEIAPSTP